MIQQTPTISTAARPFLKAAAERCAHCRRDLPTGQGTDVPGVGIVGPECAKRYAPLAAAIAKCQGLQAFEWDQGSLRLASDIIRDLRKVGFCVTVVDVAADTKEVQIGKLTRKPNKAIETWEQMRARFEQRLMDAQAEREAQEAGYALPFYDGQGNRRDVRYSTNGAAL